MNTDGSVVTDQVESNCEDVGDERAVEVPDSVLAGMAGSENASKNIGDGGIVEPKSELESSVPGFQKSVLLS